MSQEYVAAHDGWVPTAAEERDTDDRVGLKFRTPVARALDGQGSHWRFVLRCTRATCNYKVIVAAEGHALIEELLQQMATAEGYRVSEHLAAVPAEVLELNAFFRQPATTLARYAV